MIKKSFRLLFALLALLLLAACAQNMAAPSIAEEAMEAPAMEPMPTMGPGAGFASEDAANTAIQAGQTQERLIIREGTLEIVVKDSETAAADISRLAEMKDGWVVTTELYQRGEAKAGSITIRVPAEEFDATVDSIREMAVEVTSENSNSQDVTEEYVDLEARVANLEATADRVRNFLDEARNVEEALAVNQELSRLEGEIESMKARMNFLSQSAAMSRLTIYLTPDELSQPIEVGGWRPVGIARDAIDALISTFQAVASVAIWGAIFCLPILIIIGIPLYFIGRFGYRRYQRRGEARLVDEGEMDAGELTSGEVAEFEAETPADESSEGSVDQSTGVGDEAEEETNPEGEDKA